LSSFYLRPVDIVKSLSNIDVSTNLKVNLGVLLEESKRVLRRCKCDPSRWSSSATYVSRCSENNLLSLHLALVCIRFSLNDDVLSITSSINLYSIAIVLWVVFVDCHSIVCIVKAEIGGIQVIITLLFVFLIGSVVCAEPEFVGPVIIIGK